MEDPLSEYTAYPFDTDETYQKGLASMLAGAPTGKVNEEILLRARVFYFNKVTGKHVTVEQVREHESHQLSEGDRILTFSELQELIESGNVDQIPNNKIIPDKLNESPPSESKIVSRKKPWELTSVEFP